MKKYLFILTTLVMTANLIFAQNRALDFNWNGTNYGLVDVASNFGLGVTGITIECWVNLPTTSEKGQFVHVGNELNGYGIGVGAADFDNIGNELIVLFSQRQWITTGTNIGIGWHHVAFSINGGYATIYLDGVYLGVFGNNIAAFAPNNTVRIGGSYGGSVSRFLTNGYIDDVRFWSDIRTDSEIKDNYLGELSGSEANLVAYYKFNETTGTTADNAQGNASYDGTFTTNQTPPFNFDNNSVGGASPIYVDASASGTNDGTSWANAYTSLQSALGIAISGSRIWVASGTYKPSVDELGAVNADTRLHTFQMINGEIYGGFAGTETATSQRTDYGNGGANETILSGDIGTVGVNTDNCYHVFYHPDGLGLTTSAVLDGFTVTRGNANSTTPFSNGGAMYNNNNSPTLKNITFINNDGADGGAIINYLSSPIIINSVFINNSAVGFGGAIYNRDGDLQITNCTFTNNSADNNGGAILHTGTGFVLTVKNSIFWGNTAGLYGTYDQIYNLATANYYNCDIEGSKPLGGWDTNLGTDGGGNIDSDPLFAGLQNASHPYSLTGASPCLDVGVDAANTETYDIRGSNFGRKLLKTDANTTGTIDMGAYEYKFGTDGPRYYVNNGLSTGDNSGSSWANAFRTTTTAFQDALTAAATGGIIWVASGTYKPSVDENGTVNADTRLHTFQMINGVEIFGGFAGTETATSERTDYGNGGANETILSGDIGTVGVNTDNCYHVFYHPNGLGLTTSAVLDGFTVTKGNANGSTPHNNGGAMYNYNNSPTLKNITFINNAGTTGGAIINNLSSPIIINTNFVNNSSSYGGAIYNLNSNLQITNCTFTNNSAINYGGAIEHLGTGYVLTAKNSIFWGNTASLGANAQIYNAATANYYNCDIEGSGGSSSWIATDLGTDGGGNIDSDPLFYDAVNNDYRITQSSPCADVGSDAANSETTDIRGGGRKLLKTDYTQVGTIDMGAYEYNSNLDPASPTPVELVSFNYEIIEEGILLKWETATEINNYGFELQRQESSIKNLDKEWEILGFVQGHGNSNSPKYYEFLDETPSADSAEYRLKQIDTDGAYTYYAQTVTVNGYGVTDVEDIDIPKEYALEQNYPNPFNPSTTIKYSIPNVADAKFASTTNVTLKVYDILGREVATLVNKVQQPGNYSVNFDASNLASGTYIYRIISGTSSGSATEFVSVKKLLLMK